MTQTVEEDRADAEREWRERIATSLELIASRLDDPSDELVARVATCEELLKEFVALMKTPHATDTDWTDLLSDVKEALGMDVEVSP